MAKQKSEVGSCFYLSQ